MFGGLNCKKMSTDSTSIIPVMFPQKDMYYIRPKKTKSEISSIDKCKAVDSPDSNSYARTLKKPHYLRRKTETVTKNRSNLTETQSEWLLELCCSLQESALKTLRLSNEKYEAVLKRLKQNSSQYEQPVIPPKNPNARYDSPPLPPPRKTIQSPPPPLPPSPSSHIRQKLQNSQIKTPKPNDVPVKLIKQIQNLNIRIEPQPQKIYDYRISPSSGFYSCSAESSSPSIVSFELDSSYSVTKTNLPQSLITQYVKSTQVAKPQLQTAMAPINPPPSYSVATQKKEFNREKIKQKRPPPSPPNTNFNKVKYHSPIPERKYKDEKDYKVRNYSPQAFKFFMEQHIENVLKSHRQRLFRKMQLESEMTKIGLSEEAQNQMRKMLRQKESNYIRLKRAKMEKSMFIKIKMIGVGAFGEVALVKKIDTNHLYAMKTLRKVDVLKRNQVAHVKAERDILAEADNEWVVKLYYSFQDSDNLYFVMEYIPGGDLMSLLIKFGIFEESLARFYLAELTCALESVHKIGFIHRDIKPDNILIDRDGHIKLTDFGLCTGFRWTHNSKYYSSDNHNRQNSLDFSENANNLNCKCNQLKPLERRRRREHQRCLAHSLVGTPNYIAPEVLLRTGYTQLCDWWSVGVVLYEMLIGSPPFSADSPTETQYKIINWQNTLKIPSNCNISAESKDLILKLCTSPDKRLGKNVAEVKGHPFFANINFDEEIRKITPPYIPIVRYLTDTSNFDPIDPESLNDSSFVSDLSDDFENKNKPFHGFFEFTFRRFFDDGGGDPFFTKISTEENDNQTAIYV